MVEPRLIGVDALDADLKALPRECRIGWARMDGGDDGGPVHHLVAVEEMAIQNELQSGVFGGVWAMGFKCEGGREGAEPAIRLFFKNC